MKILYDTKQMQEAPKKLQQYIKIPARWFGRGGTYSTITRTVEVMGTVEVEHYGVWRKEYGKVKWSGKDVLVINDHDSFWEALEYKDKDGKRHG